MLEEEKIIDKIEILSDKTLQIREANIIKKDGSVIAKTFHRYTLGKTSDLANQPQKIKDIAEVLWK